MNRKYCKAGFSAKKNSADYAALPLKYDCYFVCFRMILLVVLNVDYIVFEPFSIFMVNSTASINTIPNGRAIHAVCTNPAMM